MRKTGAHHSQTGKFSRPRVESVGQASVNTYETWLWCGSLALALGQKSDAAGRRGELRAGVRRQLQLSGARERWKESTEYDSQTCRRAILIPGSYWLESTNDSGTYSTRGLLGSGRPHARRMHSQSAALLHADGRGS